MLWANFLHLYQPVTQKPYWINRITAECYRPLFTGLLRNPDLRLSININSVLIELLEREGHQDVIADIKTVLERGQVELTGSAKYHPLLVFIPEYERVRQIALNDASHRRYFGYAYRPRGFFPPEMAFDQSVAKTVAAQGFEWIIVDELSFPEQALVDYRRRHIVEGTDLNIYFRERSTSWNILSGQIGTPKLLHDMLGQRLHDGSYLLTAMDGETFGHHRPGLQSLLFDLSQAGDVETCLISKLDREVTDTKKIVPRASTWALMQKDLERNAPFSRWRDQDNEIHTLQWQLTELAINLYEPLHSRGGEPREDTLDQALQSDQYWWASARPWWSMEMIERGAKNLFEAVEAVPKLPAKTKAQARELYHQIVFTAFDWQRSGKVDVLAHAEDEDIRQRTDASLPQLPKAEVAKMVTQLQKELAQVVAKEEFERAVQIRDRIRELKQYSSDKTTLQTSATGDREWDS